MVKTNVRPRVGACIMFVQSLNPNCKMTAGWVNQPSLPPNLPPKLCSMKTEWWDSYLQLNLQCSAEKTLNPKHSPYHLHSYCTSSTIPESLLTIPAIPLLLLTPPTKTSHHFTPPINSQTVLAPPWIPFTFLDSTHNLLSAHDQSSMQTHTQSLHVQ